MGKPEENKRLLLVAYDFPPVASAGMYRVTSMAGHLTGMGWNTTVLTVRNPYVFQSLWTLKLIPAGVWVERTKTVEYYQLRRTVARRLLGMKKPEDPEGTVDSGNGGPPTDEGRRDSWETVKERIRWVERLFSFPDAKAGWSLPLLIRAASILRGRGCQVVLTSSPPHSTHLPFLLLRKCYKFKWVVDFRDPWTAPNRRRWNWLSFNLQRAMENSVLLTCDKIIANTEGNRNALIDAFRRIPPAKVEVITNGFDEMRIARTGSDKSRNLDCDLAYFGAIYPGMLDLYVEAIKHLRGQGLERVPKLFILGKLPLQERRRLIVANGLSEYIEFGGRVTFDESYELMKRAKSLLLLLPRGPGCETWVPSKLYTYLSTSTPIFAILPKGDASRIIQETGGGVVVDAADPKVVAEALTRFLGSIDDGTLEQGRHRERLRSYSWETLSRRLDGLLRDLVSSDG